MKKDFNYLKNDLAIPCPAGDRFKDKHILKRKGNNMFLEKIGVIDIQEQINSYEDGVCLEKMVERFKRGDSSALNRVAGFYGDVSDMPEEFIDAVDNMKKVANVINSSGSTVNSSNEPSNEPSNKPTDDTKGV